MDEPLLILVLLKENEHAEFWMPLDDLIFVGLQVVMYGMKSQTVPAGEVRHLLMLQAVAIRALELCKLTT